MARSLGTSPPTVVAVAFPLLRFSENSKTKGDTAFALVSAAVLANGAVIVSRTTGKSCDVGNYLFGHRNEDLVPLVTKIIKRC